MNKISLFFYCIGFALAFQGCSSTVEQTKKGDDPQSAIVSVTEGIAGRELSDKEIRDFVRQARNDKDARTAIESISNSIEHNNVIMYCPVCGKRFSPKVKFCPEHNVLLKVLEE